MEQTEQNNKESSNDYSMDLNDYDVMDQCKIDFDDYNIM